MREKLIMLLGQCPCDGGEELGNCPYRKHGVCAEIYKMDYCAIQNLADHLIANGVTVQEWISVKDRLPEDDLPKESKRKMIRCLVYTDKGTVKQCVRQRCISRKVNGEWVYTHWEWNKDIFAKPTHWMPLPQPPKGE